MIGFCWLVFPVVLGAICLGCGLLLERVAGGKLPTPLLMPAGLALVVVVAQLAVWTSATVALATPLVVAAAVLGFVLGRPWKRDFGAYGWWLAAAIGVYLVYGAPVLLSGQATFTGYIRLDDTATWFALTDHAMHAGHSTSHLPLSTYGATLSSYLHTGYPLGSFLPLGVMHRLLDQDIAWIFQPYMAFMAAMLAMSLYWLVRRAVESRPLAALCAFTGAQAATLYAYSLWGGVKEVAAAWLVGVAAGLAADAVREARLARGIVPVAVTMAAGMSVMSVGAGAWLVPPLIGAVLMALYLYRAIVPLRQALAFVSVAAVLAAPAIATAHSFYEPGRVILTKSTELGNLPHPLNKAQALGIWPAWDFRHASVHPTLTYFLLVLVAASGIFALVVAWRRSAWELPLYVIATVVAGAVVTHFGSPWVDGKALATTSPAFIVAGMAGGAILLRWPSMAARALGLGLTLAVFGGVVWSNALAYRDADLAPRGQLHELERIGNQFAGQGPTLMNDYEPYGARHFLRNADTESVSELRIHVIPLRDGSQVPKGGSADLDRFPLSSIEPYHTLVLHTSPVGSRPPAEYQLQYRGRYWDVWQRDVHPNRQVLQHLPLGTGFQPGDVPRCSDVLQLAATVPPGGSVAAVKRSPPEAIDLTNAELPPGWFTDPGHAGAIEPSGAGSVRVAARVPTTGSYGIWLGGSFKSRVRVYIDGRLAASGRNVLEWEPFVRLGSAVLTGGGVHDVRIVYDAPSFLHPGSGGFESGFGPLVLSQDTGEGDLVQVAPSRARQLCGQYLDWVEALGPSSR